MYWGYHTDVLDEGGLSTGRMTGEWRLLGAAPTSKRHGPLSTHDGGRIQQGDLEAVTEGKTMQKFCFRGFTSIVLGLSFLVATTSGLVLWIGPESSPEASMPTVFGLGKGFWKSSHIHVSLLLLVAGCVHLYFNWTVFIRHLWDQATRAMTGKRELTAAFCITALTVFTATQGGHGNSRRLPPVSPKEVAEKTGLQLERILSSMSSDGIRVLDPGATIKEIAEKNSMTPEAVFSSLRKAAPTWMPRGRGRPH